MSKEDTGMKLERVQKLVKSCDDLGALISPWERGFLESVQRQLVRGRTLSTKQVDVVHRVEAKIEKASKGDPEWEAEWTEEKARDFKIAVAYYESTPIRYHSQVLDWVVENPDAMPPRSFYKKLVGNKYAQKIINGVNSIPKYPAGSSVMLRATARQGVSYSVWNKLRNALLFVIEPTNRAINPAAGCRIYSLLSSTSAEMFEIEERWIKKHRTPKNSTKTITSEDHPF
tara:strand:- start:1645 stop:2331 length:687 start_codon:yes stop_codon:yes gene_type:complete